MKLKKICSVVVAAALTFSLSVTPILADEVSDLKKQKKDTEEQVNNLQTQLNSLMTKISELENDLITTGEEISQTEEDLKAAQEEQEQQYQAMKRRIKYMYEAGTGSATMEKVLSSGNTTSALKQAEYSQDLHSYDRKKLNEYVATVEKVAELKDTLETKMDDLEKTQTEYEEQKTELNTTITEKSSEIKDLDVQIDEAVKKAAEEEAKRQEEARKAAEAAAAAEAAKKNNNNRNTGGTTNSGTTNSGAAYNPSTGNAIVDAAYSQIGVPYVWGGTTPYVELDCSGLVQYCYRQAGKSIPRTSGSILAGGTIVSNPQPGDICWTPGHVAIYIGNGQMIEAQQTGVPVKVSKVRVVYYVRY